MCWFWSIQFFRALPPSATIFSEPPLRVSKNFRSPPSISSSPPLVILNELSLMVSSAFNSIFYFHLLFRSSAVKKCVCDIQINITVLCIRKLDFYLQGRCKGKVKISSSLRLHGIFLALPFTDNMKPSSSKNRWISIIDINKFSCLFIFTFMIKLKGKNIFTHTLLFTLGCCLTVTLNCR